MLTIVLQLVQKASRNLLMVAFAPAALAMMAAVIEQSCGSTPLQSTASVIAGQLSGAVCFAALACLSDAGVSALLGVIGWVYGIFAFAVHVVVVHKGIEGVTMWL